MKQFFSTRYTEQRRHLNHIPFLFVNKNFHSTFCAMSSIKDINDVNNELLLKLQSCAFSLLSSLLIENLDVVITSCSRHISMKPMKIMSAWSGTMPSSS